VRLRRAAGLPDCLALLTGASSIAVAVEVTSSNAERLPGFLDELGRLYPRVRAVVLLDCEIAAAHDVASWEWALREAGAVHAVHSLEEIESLARMVRRLTAELPRRTSLAAQVWESLPWSEATTA